MAQNLKKITIRTTVFYTLLAGLWILASDWVIYMLADDPASLTRMQTYKGLFYVIVTTFLLYFLLHAQLRRWGQSADEAEQARQALGASNDYLKAVLDATNDAILVIAPKSGEIIDSNQRLFEMYGYDPEEIIGKPIANLRDIVVDYSIKKIYKWAARVRRQGPQIMEWQTRHKDGHLFWVEVSLRFEVIGQKSRFVMSVRNINDRKEIENSLKENQRALDTLMNNLPGMVYRCKNDPNWTMAYVSQGAFVLTGYRAEDLLGDNHISFGQLIHPDDRQMVWSEIQEALQSYQYFTLTYRLKDVSNIEKWVWEQGRGVFDENDQLLFLEGFISDISEQKKAEELLRISEQTYQGILASVTEAVYIQDKDGTFIDVNQAAEKMYGYNHKEFIGRTPEFVSAPEKNDIEAVQKAVQLAYKGQPQQFEFWGLRKNGQVFPKEVSLTQGWYFGQKAVIAVARDTTARKNAELSLYRRFSELEALRTIDRAITSSFDLRITLDILLKQAIHNLGVDAAAILLFDNNLQSLQYTASQGFRTINIETIEIRPSQGLAREVMLQRGLVHKSDPATIENDKVFAKREEFSEYFGIPLIAKGQMKGILEVFHRTNLPEDPDWINFFETLANQTAIAIDNAQMFESLQHKNLELALAYDATIEGWSRALEMREGESAGHSERITHLTLQIAKMMGMSTEEMSALRHGVLLHDIGKMSIPDKILLKKGRLTKEERNIIKEHPQHAYNLLSSIGYLKDALNIPHHHHEKWDGSGYPQGLAGTQIPLAARIFAIVDVWDALTNDRPQRKAWSEEKALEYIREQSGKHFDPKIVDLFLNLLKTLSDD